MAIAYGVVGEGPVDLVYVQGFVSNVETMWELPQAAAFLERLASWSRLITIDRRGVGMSDRFSWHDAPPLEDAASDVLRVLEAVGSDRCALFGHNEGGQICAILAATAPERVRSLSLYSTPISKRQQEIEEGADPETLDRDNADWARRYGTTSFDQELFSNMCPSYVGDPDVYAFMLRFQRHSASPGSFAGVVDRLYDTDISGLLESIRVPTQVLHRTGDHLNPIEWSRRLAAGDPQRGVRRAGGRRLVALPGRRRRAARRGRAIRPRCAGRPAPGARPRHGGVHRHRGVDRRGGHDGRRGVARDCWRSTTRWPSARSPRTAADTCRRPATACSRCSTAPRARRGAPPRSPRRSATSASRSAPASTPARSSTRATTFAGSPCTSARASAPWRARPRCSSPRPFATSSPAVVSCSSTPASTSSRASPTAGTSTGWSGGGANGS